jgi:hypothetical protein
MISVRNYFTIFILIAVIFVMFMFVGVSSSILSDVTTNKQAQVEADNSYQDSLTPDSLSLDHQGNYEHKLRVAILSESKEDTMAKLLVEWCVYSKFLYKIYTLLPEKNEIAEYDLILFGDITIAQEDYELLNEYADLGKTMIFTGLPDYQVLSLNRDLAAFYGIKDTVAEDVTVDGITIFSDFMINEERNYKKGDFYGEEDDTQLNMPYYSLAPGYEVYGVGVLDKQDEQGIKDKDLPPLLWRTTTKNSVVFVVNSDIFQGMSILGVLTGFMSHEGECYLYPIVNAQTISVLDYPYFSNENNETMQQLYSRTSESVARDLLWPNVVQILKNYGTSFSFFAASQLDYLDDVSAKNDYIDFYLREISKLPGDMGLSLDQFSQTDLEDLISKNETFFQSFLPDYKFTALYAGAFSTEEVKQSLNLDFLKNITLVMSDYTSGDSLISYLKDGVLSVKFNQNGYQHETMDDLQMICIENVLGMCNMKADIGQAIYPQSSEDQWNYLSLKWSKGNTYFNDFTQFDMVSIYELEKRIRRFLALDYTYEYLGDDINIHIDHFDEEAYFILDIKNRSIVSADNASAKRISTSSWLIKATGAEVNIHTKDDNYLDKPKNNKVISSNPS